jgi:hypothetical protein
MTRLRRFRPFRGATDSALSRAAKAVVAHADLLPEVIPALPDGGDAAGRPNSARDRGCVRPRRRAVRRTTRLTAFLTKVCFRVLLAKITRRLRYHHTS